MFIPQKPRPQPIPGITRPLPRRWMSSTSFLAEATVGGKVPGTLNALTTAVRTRLPVYQVTFGGAWRSFDVVPLTVRFPWERRRFRLDA